MRAPPAARAAATGTRSRPRCPRRPRSPRRARAGRARDPAPGARTRRRARARAPGPWRRRRRTPRRSGAGSWQQRRVEEADHALLVLLRPRLEPTDVAGLGDLPQRAVPARRRVVAAVELLAVAPVRRGDQQQRLLDL